MKSKKNSNLMTFCQGIKRSTKITCDQEAILWPDLLSCNHKHPEMTHLLKVPLDLRSLLRKIILKLVFHQWLILWLSLWVACSILKTHQIRSKDSHRRYLVRKLHPLINKSSNKMEILLIWPDKLSIRDQILWVKVRPSKRAKNLLKRCSLCPIY